MADRTYASGLAPGFVKMAKEGGMREMYAGFVPILASPLRSFRVVPPLTSVGDGSSSRSRVGHFFARR